MVRRLAAIFDEETPLEVPLGVTTPHVVPPDKENLATLAGTLHRAVGVLARMAASSGSQVRKPKQPEPPRRHCAPDVWQPPVG